MLNWSEDKNKPINLLRLYIWWWIMSLQWTRTCIKGQLKYQEISVPETQRKLIRRPFDFLHYMAGARARLTTRLTHSPLHQVPRAAAAAAWRRHGDCLSLPRSTAMSSDSPSLFLGLPGHAPLEVAFVLGRLPFAASGGPWWVLDMVLEYRMSPKRRYGVGIWCSSPQTQRGYASFRNFAAAPYTWIGFGLLVGGDEIWCTFVGRRCGMSECWGYDIREGQSASN
jgi:hypothetical protein